MLFIAVTVITKKNVGLESGLWTTYMSTAINWVMWEHYPMLPVDIYSLNFTPLKHQALSRPPPLKQQVLDQQLLQ